MAHDPFANFTLDGETFVNPQEEEHKAAVKMTEEVIVAKQDDFNKRMYSVTEDLQGRSNATPMPLSIFEMIFYPLFAGEVSQEESIKRLHAWTLHAGGSYAEVPIVDDKTKKELFRVPGLITSDILNEKSAKLREAGVPSIGAMNSHLVALRNNGRFAEADEIEEAEYLKRLPDKSAIAPHAVFNMLRWNQIATALGKPPIYPKLAKVVADHDQRAKEDAANPVVEIVQAVVETPKSNSIVDDLF